MRRGKPQMRWIYRVYKMFGARGVLYEKAKRMISDHVLYSGGMLCLMIDIKWRHQSHLIYQLREQSEKLRNNFISMDAFVHLSTMHIS